MIMTKLSDLGPPKIGRPHDGEPANERDNFIVCSVCGQLMDMRDFRQVAYHADLTHKPLEMDA